MIIGVALSMGVLMACLAAWVWRERARNTAAQREITRLRGVALRRADQVSVLSHEIRTPLALVKGSADLLAEETPGPLTPVQRRFVTTISESSARVIDLAEELLIQARIEAGIFDVHVRQVELRSYLRAVVRDLRQVHDRQFTLDTPGPPTKVVLDPHLISQLIANLVANAVRHDPSPANTVTIKGYVADGMIILTISDLGRGMTEQERARLFQRFRSSAPLGEGTGIGLFISRHIAELHGGAINVDTIAQHGTTMLVTLPAGGPDSVALPGASVPVVEV